MAPDAQVIAESFAALVKQNPMGMGHQQCSQLRDRAVQPALRWWQSMEEVSTEDEDTDLPQTSHSVFS